MRNFWWWVVGGGALLWVINKSKTDEVPATGVEGFLTMRIAWKPGTATPAAVKAALNVLDAITSCGGPALSSATSPPSVVSATTATSTVNAVWTHRKMGPIQEAVRVCTLKALKALDANIVDFQATRTS